MMKAGLVRDSNDRDGPTRRKSARLSRSTVETSPLSSSLSPSELQTGEGAEVMAHTSAQPATERARSLAQDEAAGIELDTPLDDDAVSAVGSAHSFHCPHCNASYTTQIQLKKHLEGGRSKCYRERNAEWFCPRCREEFTARKGVLRHIQFTCWKMCDECCASGKKDCDANEPAIKGPCTHCVKAGQSCSMHTEAVANCPSPQKIVSRDGQSDAASPLVEAPPNIIRKQKRRAELKRRASASPENSPESKPKPEKRGRPSKRSKVAGKGGGRLDEDFRDTASPAIPKRRGRPSQRASLPLIDKDILNDALFGTESPTPGQSRPEYEATPSSRAPGGLTADDASLLPVPKRAFSELADMPRQPPLAGLSLMDGREIQGIADGTRHAPTAQEQIERRKQLQARGQPAQYGPATQELLERQRQSAQNIALMQQHMAVHNGGAFPAPVISSARSSLHMGQSGFDIVPPGRNGHRGRRSGLRGEISIHEDQVPDHFNAAGYPPFDLSDPGSRVPCRVPSVIGGRLSTPGSRVPSRQPSPNYLDFQLTGIGSHFPSRAVSPEFRPSLRHPQTFGEDDMRDHEHANDEREDHLAVSHVIPPELNQELDPTFLAGQSHDPSNPVIRLRISSNTYDPTGALIFSILTMRIHDPFGPRLEYYCTQRGKRLGIDWKIIYKYAAPTPSKPERKKYFDLNFDTTPHMCFDKEYPGARLRDGDTLLVCRRRTPADDSAENELGTQLAKERIEIENGERPMFQAEEVNVAWYQDVDMQLSTLKQQAAAMQETAQRYAHAHTQSRNMAHHLELENAQLKNQVMRLEKQILTRQVDGFQGGYAQMPPQFSRAEGMWQASGGGQQPQQQHHYQQQGTGPVGSQHGLHDTPTPQQRGRAHAQEQGIPHAEPSSLARHFYDSSGQMGGEDEYRNGYEDEYEE